MKVIGPYVISAVPHLYREVVNGKAGDGQGAGGQGGAQAGPPEPASPARQRAQRQSDQNTRDQNMRPGGRKGGRPDASANLVLSALNALPMHGIDRLTGMPVLLHRLNEFVVPAPLPDSPHLLPVTEVDIWDAHPYAVTELPPAALLATHPATAALGVLRALTALHAAGQVHGGLNAGQFWQVGREVRLAGAGLPWQPGAGADADMHALGQALDTLGARPAVLLALEQMTARQALSALEAAMPPLEQADADSPPAPQAAPVQHEALSRADLGWNGGIDAQDTPSGPGRGTDVPGETGWNRRKTDRAARVATSQAAVGQIAASQVMPDNRPEEPVAAEVAARTVIAPAVPVPVVTVPVVPVPIAPAAGPTPDPEPTPAPLPYRSADDVIVIGDALQTSSASQSSSAIQSSSAVSSEAARVGVRESRAVHPDASDGGAVGGQTEADVNREPGTESGPALGSVLTPIRIGFTDLPETDGPESDGPESDGAADPPEPLPDRTPPSTPDLQMGRATRFTPAYASEAARTAPVAGPSTDVLNPAQRARARHGQAAQAAAGLSAAPGSSKATGLPAERQAEASTGTATRMTATRMQPLRIGWEEDHSWRVVKSGPEQRKGTARHFPVWLLAVVLLALLAGAAFWLLGRAGPPTADCCSVNFTVSGTVSGSGQPVLVTLVKAPPGSTLQPGAVIGTAPGLLDFPGVAGQYTLKFSAQGHGALTAAVTVPSGQPFAIVLK